MAFSQITSGPSGASGSNNNAPGLTFDQQNGIVAAVGSAHTESVMHMTLALFQAQTALTAITTAQALFIAALNAWLLQRVGRTIRVTGFLIYTTAGTTTPTITIALVLGAVTLATITTAATSATASANLPIQFEFVFTVASTGTAGTIEAHGTVAANISANTPAAAAAQYSDTNTAVSSAVNLETALNLEVTIAASLAVSSAQLRLATVEVMA